MNILWIIADDLNDYVWAEEERTTDAPNIALLAQNASRFDACYVNSPLCCPSRASFMVGKTPDWTGVLNNTYQKYFRRHYGSRTVVTIPEHFKANGYYTVGVNKIYHNFQRSNFDNDYDFLQPNPLLRQGSWNAFFKQPEGNLTPIDRDNLGTVGYAWGRLPESDRTLLADNRAVNRALNILESFADNPAAFDNRSLFLMVGLIAPHVPHVAPESFFPEPYLPFIPSATSINYQSVLTPDGWPLPDFGPGGASVLLEQLPEAAQAMAIQNGEHQASFDAFAQSNAGRTSFTEEELRLVRMANANMAYHAAIRYFDEEVGRLIQGLDSLGLADNTLIVMHSDHGFSMGEHGHWAKNSLWETDLRVPLIIYDPRQPAGQRIKDPVSLLDLYPTLCELAGLPYPTVSGDPNYLDGQSLIGLMNGTGIARPVVSEVNLNGDPRLGCDVARSIVTEDWHYMELPWEPSGTCDADSIVWTPLLYHLETDRLEWFNVADEPANQAAIEFLKAQLENGDGAPIPTCALSLQTGTALVSTDSLIQVGLLIRTADGDTTAMLPPSIDIHWQVSIGDTLLRTTGDSLWLDLTLLPPAVLTATDYVRVDAWLENSSGEVLCLDGQTFGLLYAREAAGTPTSNSYNKYPCVLSPEQNLFYDINGRVVSEPRPFQIYLDACGNKRMRVW